MTNSHTICQHCGKDISFVHIDRKPSSATTDLIPNGTYPFSTSENTSSLKSHRVLLYIPVNAKCRNCGDEDFIRETIHCPECNNFPFGADICNIFDDGSIMSVVFNQIDFSKLDGNGNLKPTKKVCANCQKEINDGDQYFMVTDNYLMCNYFESDSENTFCSEQCLMDSLMVKSFVCCTKKNG